MTASAHSCAGAGLLLSYQQALQDVRISELTRSCSVPSTGNGLTQSCGVAVSSVTLHRHMG